MIRSCIRHSTIRSEGPRKIGHRELGNLVSDPLSDHLFVECSHSLADLDHKIGLVADLEVVGVKAADLNVKNLSVDVQSGAVLDQQGNLFQLSSDPGSCRKYCSSCRCP